MTFCLRNKNWIQNINCHFVEEIMTKNHKMTFFSRNNNKKKTFWLQSKQLKVQSPKIIPNYFRWPFFLQKVFYLTNDKPNIGANVPFKLSKTTDKFHLASNAIKQSFFLSNLIFFWLAGLNYNCFLFQYCNCIT